jgi:hypothetical protein
MTPILYIAANQYSGSTLLAFMLNTHPSITSAGHTTGWAGLTDGFMCSCGSTLSACPFFAAVRRRFEAEGLPFWFDGYLPTKYTISHHDRVDQLAFEHLPKLRSPWLEHARDTILRKVPRVRRAVYATDRANVAFVQAALRYANASVYADNSHSPYRARRLSEIPEFKVHPVHLVRDVRGVALSTHRNLGWDMEFTALHWVRVQEQIVRVLKTTSAFAAATATYADIVVHYEDLCDRPEATMEPLVRPLGLTAPKDWPSFKTVEHHILGNRMRFDAGVVRKSERWRSELPVSTRRAIENRCRRYARRSRYRDDLEHILEAMFEA